MLVLTFTLKNSPKTILVYFVWLKIVDFSLRAESDPGKIPDRVPGRGLPAVQISISGRDISISDKYFMFYFGDSN